MLIIMINDNVYIYILYIYIFNYNDYCYYYSVFLYFCMCFFISISIDLFVIIVITHTHIYIYMCVCLCIKSPVWCFIPMLPSSGNPQLDVRNLQLAGAERVTFGGDSLRLHLRWRSSGTPSATDAAEPWPWPGWPYGTIPGWLPSDKLEESPLDMT
jgi:hypothetical protein